MPHKRHSICDDFDLEEYMGTPSELMGGEAGEPEAVVLHFNGADVRRTPLPSTGLKSRRWELGLFA